MGFFSLLSFLELVIVTFSIITTWQCLLYAIQPDRASDTTSQGQPMVVRLILIINAKAGALTLQLLLLRIVTMIQSWMSYYSNLSKK
jgi:hypothetical protein